MLEAARGNGSTQSSLDNETFMVVYSYPETGGRARVFGF